MPTFSVSHVSHLLPEFHHDSPAAGSHPAGANGITINEPGQFRLPDVDPPTNQKKGGDVRLGAEPPFAPAPSIEGNHSPWPIKTGGEPASVAPPSPAWPENYALKEIPETFGTSNAPGVFVNLNGGQKFIVSENRAYAVNYDKGKDTYHVFDPGNPMRPPYAARRNPETRRWELNSDVGLKGGSDRAAERQQLQQSILGLQAQRDSALSNRLAIEQDLHAIETGIAGYQSRSLNPPSEMLIMRDQKQQQLSNIAWDLQQLDHTLMRLRQDLDALPLNSQW